MEPVQDWEEDDASGSLLLLARVVRKEYLEFVSEAVGAAISSSALPD